MIGSPPSSEGVENATSRRRSPAVTEVMVGAVGAVAAARVTVMVVVVETPVFVAMTGIAFAPTASEIDGEVTPEETADPSTVMVVDACVRVAVTLIDVVAYGTPTVYAKVPEENEGVRVPVDTVNAESVVSYTREVAVEFALVLPKKFDPVSTTRKYPVKPMT